MLPLNHCDWDEKVKANGLLIGSHMAGPGEAG